MSELQQQFNQDLKELNNKRRHLIREVEEFPESDVDIGRVPVVERDLQAIKTMKNDYQDLVEEFLSKYDGGSFEDSILDQWRADITAVAIIVREHATKIRLKKESICPTPSATQKGLELQELALKVQQLTLQEKQNQSVAVAKEKEENDMIMADTESNSFLGECAVLNDMMEDVDWKEATDEKISEAMRCMIKWQEQWNNVERSFRQYENMSKKHKFEQSRVEAVKNTYDERKQKFEDARNAIKKEDCDRGIYTLEPVRVDIIKYPSFTGSPSEDFLTFKETMIKRFRENKVKKKEQASKLRECLKGSALARVPLGVQDIDDAFKRLDEAFGNPSKIMGHTLKALEDLGTLPPEKLPSGQFNFSKRIEWFLKLEVILNKIIGLSSRSAKLAHEAFGSNTYRKLWARFPTNILDKLVQVEGEDEVRLKGILSKITKLREHAQVMDDECGSQASKKPVDPPKATADIFFRGARRYDECRICVHLSATGSHSDLFENHVSNFPTGCPKFIEASAELRRSLITKIRICKQCFHPDVIVNKEHYNECTVKKKKHAYSCTNSNCKEHMWICLMHRTENRKSMDKFKRNLQKFGLNLAFPTTLPFTSHNCSPDPVSQAVRKIRRTEKKKGGDLVPVPQGRPMFLFHATQGRTKPINTFYDNGCSDAVFLEGIPGQQLKGHIVMKGPFNIGGIGGMQTAANDEWLVAVPRTDGRKQLIQGLTVNKITSDFPSINIETAVQDIKQSDPSNTILQQCKLPPVAGGCVEMLIGIKYISVFPKEIHTLPTGLTIYRSSLASHGGKYDACLGGPHSSFAALADGAGGVARLLSHFVQGLQTFKDSGPPRITSLPMSNEEVWFAKKFNEAEGEITDIMGEIESLEENVGEGEIMEETDESDPEDCGDASHDDPIDTGSHCSELDEKYKVDRCFHCNHPYASNMVSNDERISDFKKHQNIHESGLEVEYRCPKCRECVDCKSSDRTEKISLKEESEMYEIRKSIQLDFENHTIRSTLPLKGKERDYLSSNRERAAKVLKQQCKKYHDDEVNKPIIIEAFNKLFRNGHAKLLSQLTHEQQQEFLDKEVQHHLVWRVVFSGSLSTPCRPVMDASSRTSFRKDGSGGKCLNDIVCKGKIDSLHLVKVLLRFMTGQFGMAGDLMQFYNSCKLSSQQWNLQRFLWVEDLDPDGVILEAVMTTLIYGVTSVSAQSELAMKDLADYVKQQNPELAKFLVMSRYVDDLLDSKSNQVQCLNLAKAADELFALVGLKCKGWTISGIPPPTEVSKDGLTIGIFGCFSWYSELDVLEPKIPKLHFSKPRRGKVSNIVKYFEGNSLEDMDQFVPNPLSKRQAASKFASVWDLTGKLAPMLAGMKVNLRETFIQLGPGNWDSAMPADLRQKWVKNFWMVEQIRGLKYSRAVMPPDAVSAKMRLLSGVDAAQSVLMMACWGGFLRKDGSWSNQLILGRSLLAKNESIPKSELEALCGGSNMTWVVRLALGKWVDSNIIFSDSIIALCWITAEKLRLGLFHRNRVIQVRRGMELDELYHVRTDKNPADCGTRPEKVKLEDIGPNSRWECGDKWMNLDLKDVVSCGILTPALDLRISKEIQSDFNDGLIFGDRDDPFTRGHTAQSAHVISENRVRKIQERTEFSNYLLQPTAFKFPKVVRVYGYILKFVFNARKGKKMLGHLLSEANLWFETFASSCPSAISHVGILTSPDRQLLGKTKLLSQFAFKKIALSVQNSELILTDKDLHYALLYLYRKGSLEVKKFVNKKLIEKLAYDVDGILLSKGRLIDGLNFKETGELGDLNLGSLGIKVRIPVLDRWSPLSYSIAQHVHWTIGKHRGIETTNRLSLQSVSIIQGMTLYRELANECIRCHMKRKRFLKVPMGPVAQEQLMIAPPFYITMMDLFGPVKSYVPGYERESRTRNSLHSKLYIMVSVCVTTKLVNLQALEKKSAGAIIDGFTRLSCEVGVPSIVHIDQDSGFLAAFSDAEVDLVDLRHQLWTEFGISFSTCPVSGHDQHGLVEATIKSVQETFADCNLDKKRIHATGWQSFCKLAENTYNNLPLGFNYSRSQDNTELLKIITPNMLRVGRLNSRALQGPIRLPSSKQEMLEQVDSTYKAWFKVFKETQVPHLIQQPKWFTIEKDLREGDLVYFQKRDSALDSVWTIGQVDQIIRSRDGYVRRAVIKYFNAGDTYPHLTDRSVRKLVKLWSMDESCLFDDLSEVQKRYQARKTTVDQDGKLTGFSCNDFSTGNSVDLPPPNVTLVGYNQGFGSDTRRRFVLKDEEKPDQLVMGPEPWDIGTLLVEQTSIGDEIEDLDLDWRNVNLGNLQDVITSQGFYLE